MTEDELENLIGALVDVEQGQTYYWCSCGLSKSQPFCDGSHRQSAAKPVKYVATQNDTLAFCRCKKTKSPPFCDGSHAQVLIERLQKANHSENEN